MRPQFEINIVFTADTKTLLNLVYFNRIKSLKLCRQCKNQSALVKLFARELSFKKRFPTAVPLLYNFRMETAHCVFSFLLKLFFLYRVTCLHLLPPDNSKHTVFSCIRAKQEHYYRHMNKSRSSDL